jgi:hypothetical protein
MERGEALCWVIEEGREREEDRKEGERKKNEQQPRRRTQERERGIQLGHSQSGTVKDGDTARRDDKGQPFHPSRPLAVLATLDSPKSDDDTTPQHRRILNNLPPSLGSIKVATLARWGLADEAVEDQEAEEGGDEARGSFVAGGELCDIIVSKETRGEKDEDGREGRPSWIP